MSASQAANFNLQEFSDGGVLLSGGRIYTYAYGTTTFKAAYTDQAATIPHTYTLAEDGISQYIALNARGELPAPLYLISGAYDIALKTAANATIWTRRADPLDGVLVVNATNSANAAIADDTTTNATMYPVWATSNTGNLPAKVSSTKWNFNPSTGNMTLSGTLTTAGVITASSFTGAGTGLTGTAASLSIGGNAATATNATTAANLLVTTAVASGYSTGSGGTVTQATSITTAVTLNKPTGLITCVNGANLVTANSFVQFTFNNSTVALSDMIDVEFYNSHSQGIVIRAYVSSAGVVLVFIDNNTAANWPSIAFSPVIRFRVCKSSDS